MVGHTEFAHTPVGRLAVRIVADAAANVSVRTAADAARMDLRNVAEPEVRSRVARREAVHRETAADGQGAELPRRGRNQGDSRKGSPARLREEPQYKPPRSRFATFASFLGGERFPSADQYCLVRLFFPQISDDTGLNSKSKWRNESLVHS